MNTAVNELVDAHIRGRLRRRVDQDRVIADCLSPGRQWAMQRRIAGEESVSGEILSTAIKMARHRVLIDTIREVETVNAPGDFVAGKRFIGQQSQVDVEKLRDPAVSLHHVLATPPVSV